MLGLKLPDDNVSVNSMKEMENDICSLRAVLESTKTQLNSSISVIER